MGSATSRTLSNIADEFDTSQSSDSLSDNDLPPPPSPTKMSVPFDFAGHAAPIDDEGYVRCFYPPPPLSVPETCESLFAEPNGESVPSDSVEDIRAFFDEYGFVVIRDVIPAELLTRLTESIWERTDLKHIDRNNSSTWMNNARWSSIYGSRYNEKRGFLGYMAALSPEAQLVREHPRLHRTFACVLRRPQLWFNFDRFGFMRPTKNIRLPDGNVVDQPDWKTIEGFVHWDLNPWLEDRFCRVQGVLAVSDHTATSGGFHCIPGFHKLVNDWAAVNHHRSSENGCLINLESPELQAHLQRITMRPGSIVIWDSRLPHGNWPNDDDTFRMVFYVTFFPECTDPELHKKRMEMVDFSRDRMNIDYSPLGELVAGIQPYPSELEIEDANFINMDSRYNRAQWGLK